MGRLLDWLAAPLASVVRSATALEGRFKEEAHARDEALAPVSEE